MTIRKWTIEMKADVPDEGIEPMTNVVKQYARDLLSASMLLSGSERTPMVIATAEDSFYNVDEIDIMEEGRNIHVPKQE